MAPYFAEKIGRAFFKKIIPMLFSENPMPDKYKKILETEKWEISELNFSEYHGEIKNIKNIVVKLLPHLKDHCKPALVGLSEKIDPDQLPLLMAFFNNDSSNDIY